MHLGIITNINHTKSNRFLVPFRTLKFFQPYLVSISCLDLGYFFNIFWNLTTGHSKLWNIFEIFFTQVLLESNLKKFFFMLSWFELNFKNFWNVFKLVLIVIELWNFFELVYTYDWTCMQLLNCIPLTNTTVLYLVDVPPS